MTERPYNKAPYNKALAFSKNVTDFCFTELMILTFPVGERQTWDKGFRLLGVTPHPVP